MVIMRGNRFFVRPGEKCYKVTSNLTNYLLVGSPGITEYYLEATIEADEYVLNAILLGPNGKRLCGIERNFPSEGEGCTKEMTPRGYRIRDASGSSVLEIEAWEEYCIVRGRVYNAAGEIAAKDSGDDFLILKGPAVIGRSGNSIGMSIA